MAGTTTPQVLDLTAFLGLECVIFCPSQDVYFCANTVNSTTGFTITTTAAAALTNLVADRSPAGFGKIRMIVVPYLIVRTVAGADVIVVKPV